MIPDEERSAFYNDTDFDFIQPPFPIAQFEITSILETWYALANEHGIPSDRAEWSKKDSDRILSVYYYWKQLLIPEEQRVGLPDMGSLMYSYHFDLILELYLYRKCGQYMGTIPPAY